MNSLRAWTNTDLASGEVHAYGLAAAEKHVTQIRMGRETASMQQLGLLSWVSLYLCPVGLSSDISG